MSVQQRLSGFRMCNSSIKWFPEKETRRFQYTITVQYAVHKLNLQCEHCMHFRITMLPQLWFPSTVIFLFFSRCLFDLIQVIRAVFLFFSLIYLKLKEIRKMATVLNVLKRREWMRIKNERIEPVFWNVLDISKSLYAQYLREIFLWNISKMLESFFLLRFFCILCPCVCVCEREFVNSFWIQYAAAFRLQHQKLPSGFVCLI